MNIPDFVSILGNLSQSLYPVQRLITGGAYLIGLVFVMTAIGKFRKIADHKAQSSSQEKMYSAMMYLLIGAALIYLPSALNLMANTAFGAGNVLTYAKPSTADIYSSMGLLIRTAGVLWFIRGCVLVAHSSQPGSKDGPKGLVFLVAGVLAMNFDNTIAMVNWVLGGLLKATLAFKKSQGF